MSTAATRPAAAVQPLSVLIAALGGEGGGLLSDWIVAAASSCGLPVQSTSIPGVAQRTGATTYYIEVFPVAHDELGGRDPVLALYPAPGAVDLVVASELIEAARAMENGFVSPERTTLIHSSHRVYAIAERSAMADGRFDGQAVEAAAAVLARRRLCGDFRALAEAAASALNAVLLGLVARSAVLPIGADAFREAVRARAVAVEANLAGFEAGLGWTPGPRETQAAEPGAGVLPADLERRIEEEFPASARTVLRHGVRRTIDYQDVHYARRYLDRLRALAGIGAANADILLRETARQLALWMTYEDIARVADLKSRPERYARVRREAGAGAEQPVRIREYMKPGIDELAAMLPPAAGERLRAFGHRRRRRFNVPVRLSSHTITGYLLLRSVAGLRRFRPRSLRWRDEQALIERWLDAIGSAAQHNPECAVEIVALATLNKGYGDTFVRGRGNFLAIMETLVEPWLTGRWQAPAAGAVRAAREAALADPEGDALRRVLTAGAPGGPATAQSAATGPQPGAARSGDHFTTRRRTGT